MKYSRQLFIVLAVLIFATMACCFMPFILEGISVQRYPLDSEDEAVGEGLTVTNSGSGVVSSSQDGMISAPNGANILIPSGAVPLMQDGSEGEIDFSIRQAEGQTVTLPENFNAYGPVYQLRPEEIHFLDPGAGYAANSGWRQSS